MGPVERDAYGAYQACWACGHEVEVKREQAPAVDWSKLRYRKPAGIRKVMRS